MSQKQQVFFRADGNSKMGLGHIIRCCAFSVNIGQQYHRSLITKSQLPNSLAHEADISFDAIIQMDEGDEIDFLAKHISTGDLLVLDGYAYDSAYQSNLVKCDIDFVCVDDIHAFQFYSSVIINHSGGLQFKDYNAKPGTQYYLGPHYGLLRKEFLEAATQRKRKIDNRNCFICFGGADPGNQTMAIINNNKITSYFRHLHVVIGAANRYGEEIAKASANKENVSVYNELTASEMVEVMKKCAFAICSPSTIVYEYMSVGGVVFLKQIAENQSDVIRFMIDSNLAFRLKDFPGISERALTQSLINQSLYFDGQSGRRLHRIIEQSFFAKTVSLRKADLNDLHVTFEWANDPSVRMQSFEQDLIPFESHQKWFISKLNDRNCHYYIFEKDKTPMGQIRFQVADSTAVISYLVDHRQRSNGMGCIILSKGIDQFLSEYKSEVKIVGNVKKSNIASQKSFEKLAFEKEESTGFADSIKYIMCYGN
jgi:UDP-2,4-diacetamido-2,4,6-trideoxy-beta-L-altropyranose hydrolase